MRTTKAPISLRIRAVLTGLTLNWSQTPKTGFFVTRLYGMHPESSNSAIGWSDITAISRLIFKIFAFIIVWDP